jgi:hypothetical protein
MYSIQELVKLHFIGSEIDQKGLVLTDTIKVNVKASNESNLSITTESSILDFEEFNTCILRPSKSGNHTIIQMMNKDTDYEYVFMESNQVISKMEAFPFGVSFDVGKNLRVFGLIRQVSSNTGIKDSSNTSIEVVVLQGSEVSCERTDENFIIDNEKSDEEKEDELLEVNKKLIRSRRFMCSINSIEGILYFKKRIYVLYDCDKMVKFLATKKEYEGCNELLSSRFHQGPGHSMWNPCFDIVRIDKSDILHIKMETVRQKYDLTT